jgi:hypothetical protein
MPIFTQSHSDPVDADFRQQHSFPTSHRNVRDAMKRRERFTFIDLLGAAGYAAAHDRPRGHSL